REPPHDSTRPYTRFEHSSPFNIEKPLWVFVGSTVTKAKGTKEEKNVAADIALIVEFIAAFLANPTTAQRRIREILTGKGQDTGLLDQRGNDIFAGAFAYLNKQMVAGENTTDIYRDILRRLFNNAGGGQLSLERLMGESGEVALKAGAAQEPFGLINVGDAKGLCDHMEEVARFSGTPLSVEDSDFTEAMFVGIRESSSPVNLLIGSKKFIEGWDCWRVSTMGLMHVGRSEGTQIIQLFGRGVRLKGFGWCLKRSGHSHAPKRPLFIEELETLNVFGIEADFMEKFREFLKEEGLPGNECRRIFSIPLNVTYNLGKRLRILRPKRKTTDGAEYDFKRDAAIPCVGDVPEYVTRNKVVADWYPRIQTVSTQEAKSIAQKESAQLRERHLTFLNFDTLYFEVERFKRQRVWHNLNVTKNGIRKLLSDSTWYTLYLPSSRLEPSDFAGVSLLQQVAIELLKKYCDRLYNYRKREYIEPRLELRDLEPSDSNFPGEDEYQLIVDGDESQLIQAIRQIRRDLETRKDDLLRIGDLCACSFVHHLYQPLFHVRRGGKITILPVALNESEYQFVSDLKAWCNENYQSLTGEGVELFLLRNMSRGKGVGFFEASSFHPDFILWLLEAGKQYITFVEPHGLHHEGPGSDKILFHRRIKDVENRIGDSDVILNSAILSWTQYPQLGWGLSREELETMNVLFMKEDRDHYVPKLLALAKT
ncbi:MAG: restriction endonuclease subunit R, partial [Candidatus Poribacteria bacterium]|nr:restriction endonuclease subunit R [Candidatus Poribacteria bacterium]